MHKAMFPTTSITKLLKTHDNAGDLIDSVQSQHKALYNGKAMFHIFKMETKN